MTVRDYSTTPASNNAAPPNGWPEGQAANTVNDCARQMMAEIRETCEEFPYFDWGDDPTRVDNDTFTLVGDLTARYPVGARVKLVGATTGFGRITASAFGAVTTIDVVMDSGNVPTSLVRVAVYSFHTDLDANSTGTVTLSAANGTSPLYSRADHGHALSQAIAPTWTDLHTFTNAPTSAIDGSILLSDTNNPLLGFRQTGAAANNQVWDFIVSAESFLFRTANDSGTGNVTYMSVDRTGTTVDSVAFPTDGAARNIRFGTQANVANGFIQARTTQVLPALALGNGTAAQSTLTVNNEATSGDNSFVAFLTEAMSSPTIRGSISYNRGGGLVAYNTTSDVRLKENIRDSDGALSMVMQIRVRAFDWKNMPGSSQRYWLVAQELAEVIPEAVSVPEDDADFWSVDPSKLVPLLVKAVQELQAEVEGLKRVRA